MVQRVPVRDVSRMGRATQGVRVMNLRGSDRVSAVASVVEASADVALDGDGDEAVSDSVTAGAQNGAAAGDEAAADRSGDGGLATGEAAEAPSSAISSAKQVARTKRTKSAKAKAKKPAGPETKRSAAAKKR